MASLLTKLLAATAHRPYLLPAGGWHYYQEWSEARFLRWQVPLAQVDGWTCFAGWAS